MSSSDDASVQAKNFLVWMTAAAALFFSMLVIATYIFDPTGILASQWPGAGQVCLPGIRAEPRQVLPAQVRLQRPREVFLGTSRVAFGNAEADIRERLGPSVMNLGLSTATLPEVDGLLRYAWSVGPVQRAWIGLDYTMFYGDGLSRADLEWPSAASSDPGMALAIGLFHSNALSATLSLFRNPGACRSVPPWSVRGFAAPNLVGPDSPLATDRSQLRVNKKSLIGFLRRGDRASGAIAETKYHARVRDLVALLDAAKTRGVRIVLFIGPYHPRSFDAIAEAGFDTFFRRWRDDMAKVAGQADHPGLVFLDLVDRSTAFAGSAPECADSGNRHCGFFDLTHYRPSVGRAIIELALAAERDERSVRAAP